MKNLTLILFAGLMMAAVGCGKSEKKPEDMTTDELQAKVDSYKEEMNKLGNELGDAKSKLVNESGKLTDAEKKEVEATVEKCNTRLGELSAERKPYREELKKRKAASK